MRTIRGTDDDDTSDVAQSRLPRESEVKTELENGYETNSDCETIIHPAARCPSFNGLIGVAKKFPERSKEPFKFDSKQ